MHILLVSREFPPNVVGGVAYHTYNLARTLNAAGHRVTVLSSTAGDYDDSDHVALPDVNVVRLDCRQRASPRVWFDRAVRSHLATEPAWLEDVDVIHSHEYIQFGRTSVDQPVIQKIHFNLSRKFEFFPFEQYSVAVRPFIRVALAYGIRPLESCLERRALAGVDGLIFISNLTRRVQRQETGIERPATIVHNGVDTERFNVGPESDGSYFLFVGGNQVRKGYQTIIDAFASTDIPIRVAGTAQPPGGESLSNVEFLGYVKQSRLPDLYQDARALVHPARYEPFGNIILESLACGTPVIVTDSAHCGASEILTEDVSQTVPPGDPIELRQTIETFNTGEYDSQICRKLATQYTWMGVAEQTVEFAQSLAE